MKSKLTLSIEKETKEEAKPFARRHGTSVSEMVEKFLKSAVSTSKSWQPPKGSVVADLMGSIPDKDKREYDEIIVEEIVNNSSISQLNN